MAYDNQPPPPKSKAKPQRPLTPQELETAKGFSNKRTPAQLELIWKRKMPAEANMDDFALFLYTVEQKGLDPLLSEVYSRLQYDKDSGEMKLLILEGIHGMLKAADRTGELDGIETSFETDEGGNLASATTTIHKKGCRFPFKATAYWPEYNANTFIWRTKPRVMLGKCATALALRLAFAAALAGVYIAEEFERDDNRPAEDEHFEVGTITEPEPDRSGPEPAFGTHIQEAVAIVKDWAQERRLDPDVGDKPEPPAATPPQETPDAPDPMPVIDYKERNKAFKQRVMKDLEISPALQAGMLSLFFKGWVGSDDLPKDPSIFTPGWQTLDDYQTHFHVQARQEFIDDARALGQKLKAHWITEQSKGENNGSNKHSEEVLPEGDQSHRR